MRRLALFCRFTTAVSVALLFGYLWYRMIFF